MKVTREKAAENRAAIVTAAERLFREHGFDGVGIADITRAAGLTHGGFYGHFANKDALAAEACTASFADSLNRLAARLKDGKEGLKTHLSAYLSPSHIIGEAPRCPMVAFAGDIGRQDPQVRARFAEGLAAYMDAIAATLPFPDPAARQARATTLLSAMVGALNLARATATENPALAQAMLERARTDLLALVDAPACETGAAAGEG